jgi:hypothetical protein
MADAGGPLSATGRRRQVCAWPRACSSRDCWVRSASSVSPPSMPGSPCGQRRLLRWADSTCSGAPPRLAKRRCWGWPGAPAASWSASPGCMSACRSSAAWRRPRRRRPPWRSASTSRCFRRSPATRFAVLPAPTFRDRLPMHASLFAGVWTLTEWLRGTLFTGFPWLAIGYSQSPPSPLAGWASVLGVYGLGFIVALIAALLATGWRKPATWAVVAALLGGGGLLRAMDWTQPVGAPITVSLLQGNVPQSLKWDPEHLPRRSIPTYNWPRRTRPRSRCCPKPRCRYSSTKSRATSCAGDHPWRCADRRRRRHHRRRLHQRRRGADPRACRQRLCQAPPGALRRISAAGFRLVLPLRAHPDVRIHRRPAAPGSIVRRRAAHRAQHLLRGPVRRGTARAPCRRRRCW